MKNKNNFNQVTLAGFVKNSLMMTMKKFGKFRGAAHWSFKKSPIN